MKFIIAVCFCALVVFAQQPEGVIKPKTATRSLPADILRDFPRACFASTNCRVFQVNETWPLFPFCGRSTCLLEGAGTPNARLVEFVEDCGLEPKASEGCALAPAPNATEAVFPDCCPSYICQPGAELVFPTPEEIAALRQAPITQAAQPGPATA